ncbi:MAG: hypothetical protein J6J36_02595 [Clostridia bacterium]|nr:hypothetical protein [Clostridia bacterium]
MNSRIFRTIRLFIIIAIILAVGAVGLNYAFKLLKQKQNDDVRTDLLVVQAKIKVIRGKAKVSSNTESYVGTKISEYYDNDVKEFLKNIQINESQFEKYYILSMKDLEKMGISGELKNPEDNQYIVNYDTADVIYKKGIKENGEVKYKISDIITKENPKYWILHNRAGVEK